MNLNKINELKKHLLNWHKDNKCLEIVNCENCPFDKNKICERLQLICKELTEK